MKKNNMRFLPKVIALLLAVILLVSNIPTFVQAENSSDDPFIVVSLGDSYSSGEGIEPFYGQEKGIRDKVADYDWLAHRSTKSWPSLLEIPGVNGTLKNYRADYGATSGVCEWYFGAVSGAETKHFSSEQQVKKYAKDIEIMATQPIYISGKVDLPYQIDVFREHNLQGKVDYVTLSVGGNDVGFSDIVTTCVTNASWLHFGKTSKLEDTFTDLWAAFDIPNSDNDTKGRIKEVYQDIQEAAGSQAEIIVAGYPKLLDKNGKGAVINKQEATLVNSNVTKFNDKIEEIVNECRASGMNIHFVDVETEFDKDGGHQAYSNNAWINKVMLGAKSEDIDDLSIASSYSIHPNEEGAKAYARCVNAKIAEIEAEKRAGTLFGKICMASDRTTPVANASVTITSLDINKSWVRKSDESGSYEQRLPAGRYLVTVLADGYIDFHAYATIEDYEIEFMETFLMVEGDESDIGTATGKISNAMTGNGVGGITLDVRSGWNNETGDILTTTTTDTSGNYTVTLPIGNYTMCASKDGYVPTMINVVVQKDVCTTKNASMTPIIAGNSFRVVLTWGSTPSDLDSHVVGTLSNGNYFHVYFSDKSEYDGGIEVCNLDVDDTTSYGPETVTLNTTTSNPYYYYIYNYSSSTGLITSEAQIKVYQGENLVATFNVPTNQTDARYWNVFAIVDGEMVVSNTITSSADLSYAGTSPQSQVLPIDVEAQMVENPKK